MRKDMWGGQQIFFLKTTLYMIVTEELVKKIKQMDATNIDFVPI